MDIAQRELRTTIGKARYYFIGDEVKHATVLRSHIQAILEDVALLEKYRSSFKDKEQEMCELLAEARRLKRDIEKAAFELEFAGKKKDAPASTGKSNSSLKLPRIKLPQFDGETGEDYRGFMDAFEDTLSCEPDLGEVRKWLLLKAQLSGRALELVKELPTAPETYQVAVKILEDAYGSTRRAVLKLYQRVQALPQAEMETVSLRTTHAQLEGILMSLKNLSVNPAKEDFLRSVVISKFPNELIHTLRVSDETELTTFQREMGAYIRLRDCTIQPEKTPPAKTNQLSSGTKGCATDGTKAKPRHLQGVQQTEGGGAEGRTPPPKVNDFTPNNSRKKRKPERTKPCIFCTGNHWSDECDTHKTLAERQKLVEDRCPRCLRPKHVEGESCTSKRTCFYCREASHNSALCPKQYQKVLFTTVEKSKDVEVSRFITAVLPVSDAARTREEGARAVLDTAGGRSLITEDLATKLALSSAKNSRHVRLLGANNTPISGSPAAARKLLLLPKGLCPIEIDVFVVKEIATNVVATDVNEVKRRHPRYADLPMPSEGNGEEVQLLLGYRALTSIVTLQNSVRLTPRLQLLATKFGWVPFGPLTDEDEETLDSRTVGLIKEVDPIRLMCDLELVGLAELLRTDSEEERLALDKFYETTQRIGKRYEIEWPYRTEDPELDDNFGLAFGRLVSLHRQLMKTPAMLRAYDKLIRDQLGEQIVEPVNVRNSPQGLVHYLPHRAVIRLGKSTPIRMVFDAAARSNKAAKSLNDLILKGGNWVNEIPAVLMRFRRYRVGVTSDIARAFHQISIAPKDRDVVRFLWLRDPNKPPSKENLCVYRFKRMAFGVVASPFLLTATIRHHLREYPNEFSKRIEEDLYADNLITSLPATVDGVKFYHTIKECFAEMSMNISQWTTDCGELRQEFAAGDALPGKLQAVLGLDWNVETGQMAIRSPKLPLPGCEVVTKKNALREMATVYDPLGWVSPVVLIARLFLRKVWREKYSWDKPLETALVTEWQTIREKLNQVAAKALPRAYGFNGIEEADVLELHAFCDASAEAYGVAIYLKVIEQERSWTGLVAAKTRLTPNTPLTIPRLELLAAVTACKYLSYVESNLKADKQITKYLWGDSRCVIAWASSKRILPAFVERSVRLIKEAKLARFLYVPSAQNPADAASRGASMEELQDICWWQGPRWLVSEKDWPPQKDDCERETKTLAAETLVDISVEEEKILLTRAVIQVKRTVNPADITDSPLEMNPNDFRNFGALLRRTAYVIRAAGRFLRGRGTLPALGPLNYEMARRIWLRWDQQRIYEPASRRNTNVSYLKNLRVSEDEHGLIRCETRIKKAKVTRDEAEPILLVKRSRLTKLIILSVHQNNFHAGTAHTLAALRRSYWLPQGRREVYQVIKENCNTCRRYTTQPFAAPEMAPLPPFRVNRTETPFTNIGVDVFGPFKIRDGEERDAPIKKRWVMIFTCLVVRAVHLEVLRDMTATEFLNSLRRFAGRRGVPKLIICDNAPQFYVVEGVFQCVFRRFAEADIAEKYYAQNGIQWRFIPACSPWMGGAYERLIKEIKSAFSKVYGGQVLKENQFEITIIEIEGVINGRPITYVDKDSETDLITPSDFLCMRYPAVPLDFAKAPTGSALAELWKAGEEYLERFWKIWAEQYLREIRERRDSMRAGRTDENRTPEIGELVLMIDPNLKRSSWRKAVVERLIKSEDNKIRSVQLRSSNRTRMIRPIIKIAPLRLLMDLPEEAGELVDNRRAIVVQEADGEVLMDG